MIYALIALAIALVACIFLCFKLSVKSGGSVGNEERIRTLEADCNKLLTEKAILQERFDQANKRLAAELQSEEKRINELKDSHNRQLAELKESHAAQIAMLNDEHARQLADERASVGERFKALAADLLNANSQQLDRNSRISIEAALAPMKTSLEAFTKGYRECYDIENRDRLSLREEIRSLHELNTRVEKEAGKLASALKGDTRVQGRWGEMMLANILEHSGLQEGRWFVTQESSADEEGRQLRPDAVIHCPKDRDIIIDSKVSLSDYLRMLEADSPEQKSSFAKAHLRSVESHIKELRDKDYQSKIGAKNGDFVLMFMPHEGAYIEAMNANPDIWQKAYEGHVIIVSPTHLVTVVRLVEQMWQNEDRTVNSEKIATTGQKMIDSVQAFLKDMDDLGKSIDKSQQMYSSALKRLTTGNNNVLRVAENLKQLGIKSKKALPERFAELEEDTESDGAEALLP